MRTPQRRLVRLGSIFLGLLLLPTLASAQSAITGLVRDTTGAVLPGVTVEAASPVLIEKVRTVVSDGEGRYTIDNLRPGTYVVTFTLTGFSTLRREGFELPGNSTMTLNADLRVGAVAESVSVTGASPIVDVQNTQRTQVLTRDLLDALPTARNYSGLAALMPGVRMTNTDVGGNQQMEQIYMVTHGSRLTDTTVQVDGMALNSLLSDNQVQAYFSDAANSEVTYQMSGLGADVSGGGVKINMIPKEGGNRFSGSAFIGGTDGSWQGDNVTPELKARGLKGGNRITHIYDINFGLGGPIMKDKLWFFGTYRKFSTNDVVANAFYKDGRPAEEEQGIQNQMVRLTWQMTPRKKQDHRVPRSVSQVQAARVGSLLRSGNGSLPPRSASRAVCHRTSEVDLDGVEQAAGRNGVLYQLRVPDDPHAAWNCPAALLAGLVYEHRKVRSDDAGGV